MGRLARLDFTVFDDAREERAATAGAVAIVLGSSLMAGIGSWLWAVQHDEFQGLDTAEVFLKTVLAGGLIQTAVWFIAWVYMSRWVLARLAIVQPDITDMTRTMGLAFAPVALSLFVAVSPLAIPFGVFSLSLAFLFSNIALEQTAGVSTREATIANLGGFAAFLVFMGAFANVAEAGSFGGLAPGLLFFSLDF
jgi:hypothetical protein